MKTILCYGDSNVWGNIPGSYNPETGLSQRFPKNKRWTGILADLYQALAKEENCDFFDAALYVKSSKHDGIHLEEADQMILGKAIADKVKDIFN